MIYLVEACRNRRYEVALLVGLSLWFFSFFLQSCAVGSDRLNITPITERDLLGTAIQSVEGVQSGQDVQIVDRRRQPVQAVRTVQVVQRGEGVAARERLQGIRGTQVVEVHRAIGPLYRELREKVTRLVQEGFVGGDDYNRDIKKHLMFVFYYSLRLKIPATNFTRATRDEFVNNFNGLRDTPDLVWNLVPVDRTPRIGLRMPLHTVEFRLKNLLTHADTNRDNNLRLVGMRNAPDYMYNNGTSNISEQVRIDHLLKDNRALSI